MGTTSDVIDTIIKDGTDEEVLFNFGKFLSRIGITTNFVKSDETSDELDYQVMVIRCGDMYMDSLPQKLDHPLIPANTPTAAKVN
jgi:hypothetical protein